MTDIKILEESTKLLKEEISSFNQEVIDEHNKHYENSPTGLINRKLSPNENTIYWFFHTGEIYYQKGGDAYGSRSLFNEAYTLEGYSKLGLEFVFTASDDTTYVILTRDQCYKYRERMSELINKLNK
jgi:hypothetical protein